MFISGNLSAQTTKADLKCNYHNEVGRFNYFTIPINRGELMQFIGKSKISTLHFKPDIVPLNSTATTG